MSQEPKPRLYAQTTKRKDLSSSGRNVRRRFRRKKGAFDRFMSNQVDGEGTKIIGVEPVTDRPDHRHRWWDPIEGTSPLPDEEAKIKDWRAAQFRAARARRAAARAAARAARRPGTNEPPVKQTGD